MQAKPRVRSCQRRSCRLEKTLIHVSNSPLVFIVRPKSDFSCDDAMVMAAAEVKPLMTGWDIKLMRKPVGSHVKVIMKDIFFLRQDDSYLDRQTEGKKNK